jgi:hypothetical protein
MLSREATKHSNGLVEILAPLFGLNLGDHGMVEGKSPYTPDNVSKDIHFRFFEIFRAALKFKSSSVITKQRYEFAVHSLECSIQNSHTDTSSVRSRKYSLSPDLWRSASLRIYEAGPRDHLNPLNDALVKLGNFVEFDSLDRRPECLHTSHIMCQMSDQSSKLFNPPIVQRNESQRDVSLSPRSHGEMMKQGMGHECEASQSTLTNESGHTPDVCTAPSLIQIMNMIIISQMPATELVNKSRFSCGKCPRTFTRADHLERHRALSNTHSFVRPCISDIACR